MQKKIIPQATYDKIKEQIVVNQRGLAAGHEKMLQKPEVAP